MNRLLVRALAATALVLGAAGPAHAERDVVADAKRDVVHVEGIGDDPAPKPRDRVRDITAFSSSYADDRVALTLTMRRLGTPLRLFLLIRTAPDTQWLIEYQRAAGLPAEVALYPPGAVRVAHRGAPSPVSCPGLRSRHSPAKERLRVVVPEACIGSPASIRTAAVTETDPGSGGRRVDDARVDVHNPGPTKFGPRLEED